MRSNATCSNLSRWHLILLSITSICPEVKFWMKFLKENQLSSLFVLLA